MPAAPDVERLRSVLAAAERLLEAREDQMVTLDNWDMLAIAVAACHGVGPSRSATERDEAFWVDEAGFLVRTVKPQRGGPYQHRCPAAAFEAVAHAAEDMATGITLERLQAATGVPFSQVAVAIAFLKDRGCLTPGGGRTHIAAPGLHLDAMTEYYALREKAGD